MTGTPEQWEKSISNLGGQLVEALKPVAQKMGVAAEHLYGVLVRQSVADSLGTMLGWGILASFVLYGGYAIRKRSQTSDWPTSDKEAAYFVSWLITAVGFIIISCTIGFNISGLINPEYFAIKTLIEAASHGCAK